jgi:hypothetical protein
MKNGKAITTGILLVTLAFLLLYDAIAVNLFGYPGTISIVVYEASKNWPIIPFLAGIVCGHFWFPLLGIKDEKNK